MICPAYILMGVSGAGKSLIGQLLAERLGAAFEDADDHHLPENRAKLAAGIPLTDEDRRPWYAALRQIILGHRAAGKRLVLACSSLHSGLRAWLRGDDEENAVCCILLESPRNVLKARLEARRGHFMPASLLDNQLATLEITPDLLRVNNDREPQAVVQSILQLIS
ncbi:MAG: gluconokinase [Prosthecobacter sp.]